MRAERHQGQSCKLKELDSERDTYDGAAKYGTDSKLRKSRLPAYEQDPKDIAEYGRRAGYCHKLLTERHRTKVGKLKALNAEGNAYDSKAKKYSQYQILYPADKSAADKPQDVCNKSHILILLFHLHYTTADKEEL